jgi:translocation and assembly module TamA
LETTALASFTRQEIGANAQWFVLEKPSRFHLRPSVFIRHENVTPYENLTGKIQLAPAWTADTQRYRYTYQFGPTLNLTRTFRGSGPAWSKFMSLGAEARFTDHYYEFYRASPRQGFDLRVEGNSTARNVLSNVSAQLLRVAFEKLWNISSYDPPLVVIGVRGRLGTTFTGEDLNTSGVLPTDFRHFLGGSADIRGFKQRELPGEKGALTEVYLGVEARFMDVLPFHLQPLVFVDGAAFGTRPLSLDGAFAYSPGFGVRWESPIGVIRTTLAYGLFARRAGIDVSHSHPQLYFSFGEEF